MCAEIVVGNEGRDIRSATVGIPVEQDLFGKITTEDKGRDIRSGTVGMPSERNLFEEIVVENKGRDICSPIDPRVMKSGDEGKPFVNHMADSETAKTFAHIMEPIINLSQV